MFAILLTVPKSVLMLPQSAGRVPYDNCAERPPLCAYAEGNNDNAPAPGLEMAPQSEPGSVQSNIAACPRTEGRQSAIPADASETPRRDVQKELGDAMSEFDMLKAKLAEAEQRVRRLEAEEKAAELERRVSLSSSHVPQTQTAWPSLVSLQPTAPSAPKPVEPPAWQVALFKDYASSQEKQKNQNNAQAA